MIGSAPDDGDSGGGATLALPLVFPADVLAVLAGLAGAYLAVLLPPGSPVRILVALLALTLLPGYALTTVAFPAERRSSDPTDESFASRAVSPIADRGADRAAISPVERAALSFGLSLALIPLFGLVVQVVAGGYRLEPMLWVLSAFVLLAMAVGVVRRSRTPADERYDLPVGNWVSFARSAFFERQGIDLALNVALALAIVISTSTLAFALVAPQDGSRSTGAYLLAPQENGELAGKNYPTEFERGVGRPLAVAVTNNEGEATAYTVVVELQRLDESGNVLEDAQLARFSDRVAAGETWTRRHNVTPTFVGERLRLSYLVYKGDPPSEISSRTAYRDVSIRINVTATANASGAPPNATATGNASADGTAASTNATGTAANATATASNATATPAAADASAPASLTSARSAREP